MDLIFVKKEQRYDDSDHYIFLDRDKLLYHRFWSAIDGTGDYYWYYTKNDKPVGAVQKSDIIPIYGSLGGIMLETMAEKFDKKRKNIGDFNAFGF